ncbi:MAG: DNA repair protein RecO [Candidatus Izemoplasmatales bacterium]
METKKTEVIICKHQDYKESSRLLVAYSLKGRLSFLAQGANKLSSPLRSSTETLNRVLVSHTGRNLQIIKDIEVIKDYSTLKTDLIRYTHALHLLELVLFVLEGDTDNEILYPFLVKILDRLETEPDYQVYVLMFESKLLYLIGLQPRFSSCLVCGGKEELLFSVPEGGMCCSKHRFSGKLIPRELVRCWEYLYRFDLNKDGKPHLEIGQIRDLRALIDEYYEYHVNVKTNSRTLIRDLVGY